jgi:hypothetical protein
MILNISRLELEFQKVKNKSLKNGSKFVEIVVIEPIFSNGKESTVNRALGDSTYPS